MAVQNFISGNNQQFRKVQLIYFTMIFSLVGYLALGLWLRPSPSEGIKASAGFTQISYFLSASMVATIFVVRKKLYRRDTIAPSSPEEISNQMSFYQTGHLLIYVLCEAIGLIALLLLFLTSSIQHFVNLVFVSLILMVVLYPRKMAGSNL